MTIREKILVVEDEKSISHFISAVLNTNGYEAMQARTGQEALSNAAAGRSRTASVSCMTPWRSSDKLLRPAC